MRLPPLPGPSARLVGQNYAGGICILLHVWSTYTLPQILCLHAQKFRFFPLFWKRQYSYKLFTRLMKMSALLVFPFTCSRAYCDKQMQSPSLIHPTVLLKRSLLQHVRISKNLMISKCFIMLKASVFLCLTRNVLHVQRMLLKPQIISAQPTCLNRKMLQSKAWFRKSSQIIPFTWPVSNTWLKYK